MDFDISVAMSTDDKFFYNDNDDNENASTIASAGTADAGYFKDDKPPLAVYLLGKAPQGQNDIKVEDMAFPEIPDDCESALSIEAFNSFCEANEEFVANASFMDYLVHANFPMENIQNAGSNHLLVENSYNSDASRLTNPSDGLARNMNLQITNPISFYQEVAYMPSQSRPVPRAGIAAHFGEPMLKVDVGNVNNGGVSTPVILSGSTSSEVSLFSHYGDNEKHDTFEINFERFPSPLNEPFNLNEQLSLPNSFIRQEGFQLFDSGISSTTVYIFRRCLKMLGMTDSLPRGIDISYTADNEVYLYRPTIEDLLDETNLVNETRRVKLKDIERHAWIPTRLWSKDVQRRYLEIGFDPSLYIAVLRRQGSPSDSLSFDGSDTLVNGSPSNANGLVMLQEPRHASSISFTTSKKTNDKKTEKPQLSCWDPTRVHYPLGYIHPDLWFHMNDLEPHRRYEFDLLKFMTAPPPEEGPVIIGRQATSKQDLMENRYDPFYLRVNKKTNLRQNYCGCCQLWHNRDKCNYLHHMKSAHGIRSKTRQAYTLPHIMSERPDKRPGSQYYIGFCDICQSWQNANNSTAPGTYSSWFLHQASHDIERNKLGGCSGKKSSRDEVLKAQEVSKRLEVKERIRALKNVERIMDYQRVVDPTKVFKGHFFNSAKNFTVEMTINNKMT